MTAQFQDIFRIENSKYCMVQISDSLEFDPRTYGVVPESICTACYNGYFCEYDITQDGIYLRTLYINARDNYYPEIEGVGPWLDEEGRWYHEHGHHIYRGLNIKINFTGKILIGDGEIDWNFRKWGLLDPWAYEYLEELIFKDGILIKRTDQSQIAAAIRNNKKKQKAFTEEKMKKRWWEFGRKIEEPSLEYIPKLWWTVDG